MKTEELKVHLEDGKIWNLICGPEDDGLLPFLLLASKWPLFVKKWKSIIAKRKMSAFRSLLDAEYVKNLCRAGRAFEEMISTGSQQVFEWENEGHDLQANGWAKGGIITSSQTAAMSVCRRVGISNLAICFK
jgi:hypothetical protein